MSTLYVDNVKTVSGTTTFADGQFGGTVNSSATLSSGLTFAGTTTGTHSGTTTGTISSLATFPSGKFIPLKGITHSEGSSSASGNNYDMLSISVNLTGYTDYLLFAWAHTAISENSNHSNTSRMRIKLNNGSALKYIASQRQGLGAHSDGIALTTNQTAHLSCQGYYVVESAYATTCTLIMNGGTDSSSGAFTWGDQGSYSHFDGETPAAGGTLGFLLFHP